MLEVLRRKLRAEEHSASPMKLTISRTRRGGYKPKLLDARLPMSHVLLEASYWCRKSSRRRISLGASGSTCEHLDIEISLAFCVSPLSIYTPLSTCA